jgi:hypothetical protein
MFRIPNGRNTCGLRNKIASHLGGSKRKDDIMKNQLLIILGLLAGTLLLAIACSKKNEEVLKQSIVPVVCTTDSMTYSKDILPILQSYCYGCHGNGNTGGSGGISLDGYSNLKFMVDNGKLVGTVTHASGFFPMPSGQPKMPDCEVSKIVAWVDQGAQNN